MDWIERWFNLYPDNGDGSLELLVFAMLFATVAVLVIATRPSMRRAIRKGLAAIVYGRAQEHP